jgi:hypothetical protein
MYPWEIPQKPDVEIMPLIHAAAAGHNSRDVSDLPLDQENA